MFAVTRFYVHREARGATVPEPEVFHDRDAALRRGAFIGRRAPTIVYSVRGEPVSGIWDRPTLVARFSPVEMPLNAVEAALDGFELFPSSAARPYRQAATYRKIGSLGVLAVVTEQRQCDPAPPRYNDDPIHDLRPQRLARSCLRLVHSAPGPGLGRKGL